MIVALVTAALACGPSLDIVDPEVRECTERIYSNDPRVRFEAVAKLGEMGPRAIEAVPHILKRLEVEKNWLVAGKLTNTLGEIGSAEAIPGLLAVLKKNGLEEIVREIGKELEREDRSKEKIVEIIKLSGKENPGELRYKEILEVIEGANLDSAELWEYLKTLHERIRLKYSQNINVKAHAMLGIGMILEDTEPSPSVDEATALLATYLSPDTEYFLRIRAVEVLGMIGCAAKSAVPALEELQRSLKIQKRECWEEDCLAIDDTLEKCTRPSDSN